MHQPTLPASTPRGARQIAAASLAYLTTVCASMAAAAAVVTATMPLAMAGI